MNECFFPLNLRCSPSPTIPLAKQNTRLFRLYPSHLISCGKPRGWENYFWFIWMGGYIAVVTATVTLQTKRILFLGVNVLAGPEEDRMMTTGLHTVCDIYCNSCHQIVGWKYERAYEKSQKYKEGKFILERGRITDADTTNLHAKMHPSSSDGDEI